jgi:hypothetical protein
MCEDKVRYSDERAAQRELTLLTRAGFHMKPYRCKRCGAVHLATVGAKPQVIPAAP